MTQATRTRVSKVEIELAQDLHERVWQELKQQLTENQIELVRDMEGLYMYAEIAAGRIASNDAGRADAPISLRECMNDALDRLRAVEETPTDLEQLAASVVAEDDAACNAFVKRARLMMEGMKPSAQFEIIAEANERALAERPDLDDAYRAEVEGRIAQARRLAAELKEQGR